MLHGDLLRIEHAGSTSWRLLRSSQGHAPDDDDDDDDDMENAMGGNSAGIVPAVRVCKHLKRHNHHTLTNNSIVGRWSFSSSSPESDIIAVS